MDGGNQATNMMGASGNAGQRSNSGRPPRLPMPWIRAVQTVAFVLVGASFLVGTSGLAGLAVTLLLTGGLMLSVDAEFRAQKRGKFVIAGTMIAAVVLFGEQFHRLVSADALQYYETAGRIAAMTFWSLIAISFLFWSFIDPVDPLLARAASGVAVPLWLIGWLAPFIGDLGFADQGAYPFGGISRALFAASFVVQALAIWKVRKAEVSEPRGAPVD